MEAKNLRIGNFIHAGFEKKVVDVLCDSVNTQFDEGLPYDMIAPIELSEKWLFNFGFKYQDRDVNRKDGKKERFYMKHWFDEGDEYYIELQLPNGTAFKRVFCWLGWDIGGGKRFVHFPKKVIPSYVHELQNLFFALSGDELELKEKASACG